MLFYVGSEIMPLISRVEHRPRVCVSHKPCINGLYSIILPKNACKWIKIRYIHHILIKH